MSTHDDLRVGDEIPALRKGPVNRQRLVEWCAAENDYYPLHYDERVAAAMGLPGTPIQGTYKLALMGQVVTRWLAERGVLLGLSARYRGPNMEGEVLVARARIATIEADGLATLEVWIEGPGGERTTDGIASVRIASDAPPVV